MAGSFPRRALLLPLGAFLLLSLAGCVDDGPTAPETVKPAYAFAMTGPVVNDNGDDGVGTCADGTCTLREAVEAAEDWQTITFAEGFTGPIVLGQQIHIEKPLAILWTGAEPLTVDAAQTSPNWWGSVFHIVNGTVLLTGLRITGGNILGEGGGIHVNYGELQLVRCVVTGNSADQLGGGIFSYYSTVTIRQSTISNNTAGYSGGGIDNAMGSTLTIEQSTINGNTSGNDGGGISNEWGTMLLDRVTVSGNHAEQLGGGLACFGEPGCTIINSTISGNTAPGYGGGGGIAAINAFVQLGHSTVTDNQAAWGGGISASEHEGTNVQVRNSIVWGNRNGTSADDLAAELETMGFSSLGYNLVGVLGAGNAFTATGDKVGVAAAELGALAVNEPGSTATHALLEGSPALDAGTCTDAAGATVETDQRGVTRPQGSACDIGAYEVVSSAPPPSAADFECTAKRNSKNGLLAVQVTWANADPGVTLIRVTDGRTVSKQQAPSASGTWSTSLKTASSVTYEVWGGSSRKDASHPWVAAGTVCDEAQ